jgi:hypothetical protein
MVAGMRPAPRASLYTLEGRAKEPMMTLEVSRRNGLERFVPRVFYIDIGGCLSEGIIGVLSLRGRLIKDRG